MSQQPSHSVHDNCLSNADIVYLISLNFMDDSCIMNLESTLDPLTPIKTSDHHGSWLVGNSQRRSKRHSQHHQIGTSTWKVTQLGAHGRQGKSHLCHSQHGRMGNCWMDFWTKNYKDPVHLRSIFHRFPIESLLSAISNLHWKITRCFF